jgi:predicted transposase YbfD/YdcC
MDAVAPSLVSVLAQVPDPRGRRGRRHPWPALLLLVVVALLSGANTQRACARWGQHAGAASRRRLGFARRDGPSLATVHRLLQRVSVADLEARLGLWLGQVRRAWAGGPARWLDGIAVDGKTLRGARRLGARDVHLLSACCQRRALVLRQAAVPDTTNELGAIGPFLATVPLAGETVTFDAAFTQWLVAEQVVRQGGAYLMAVKANQPALLDACAAATAQPPDRARPPTRRFGAARTVRRAHGRREERTLWAAAAPPDLGFPWVRQLLRLDRRVVEAATGAVRTEETVYALTSLAPEQARPRELLRLWQRHWWIENKLHWVRDAVFGEDAATTRTGTAPQALAAFRNLALSLLHRWRRPDVTAARQFFGAHPTVLLRLLSLPTRQ